MNSSEKLANVFQLVNAYNGTEATGEPPTMTDNVTRYELDAKVAAIETRMDSKIDRIVESNARIETGMTSLKNTVIVTGITAVLAIVFGVAAFNATLLGNMTASFESGKNTAEAIAKSSEELRKTQDDLKAIREQLVNNAKSQAIRVDKPK